LQPNSDMKKIVSLSFALAIVFAAAAQTKTDPAKANLIDRASDHFMFQFSSDHWGNEPDSISGNQKGFSRGVSVYFMIDKPFKSNPKYSVAFGLGVSNSNIFFDNMQVSVAVSGPSLQFPAANPANPTATRFKKYKLSTTYLEVPVELRYTAHPERENKSFKMALGIKTGIILDAHTKAKNQVDENGNVIGAYTEKESSTNYFSGARLITTARLGYGNFSLFGNYQITSVLKPGAGPDVQFFQIGIGLSGL
jgi:hypothetical protein